MKKYFWFLTGLVVTISLLWPLVAAPYFSHHDDVQAIRLYEMDKCFKDGQIPCRWVPDLGGLYGYPLFNYYAPLPYYIGEVFYLVTSNLLLSAKIMFALSFIGSYIFMYLLGRKLWGDLGGLVSGVFYSLAPYHAVAFYVRGAMGEMWSLMFFPAIFWAILRLKESTRISNILILALFVAGLTLSHNISTMIFMPVLITFAALLFLQKKDWRFVKLSFIGILLGFMLSAFYFLPMLAEKNLVHVESMTGGYFSYTEHFKGLRKLFLDNSWGWGASVREVPGGERDGMSFQIGWVHLLGWFLALVTAKLLWNKNRQMSVLIAFFSLLSAGSVFMIHPRSEFVWKLIDPLKYVQFPWRFLMMIIFALSVLAGSVFVVVPFKAKRILALVLVILVVGVNYSYFRPEKFLQLNDQQLLTGKEWDKQIKRSIFDFLPIYAQEPPAELQPARYEVVVGDSTIKNYQEGTNWFRFQADTKTHTILSISKYYFPNWKVLVNGKEVKIDYRNNHLGLLNVILGPGNQAIEGRLYDTTSRSLGNVITVLAFLMFIVLGLAQIPRVCRWINYYLGGLYR